MFKRADRLTPMMILRTAPASPFGRKVRIAARLLGLDDAIRVERADTMDPADSMRVQNPLGKIPILLGDDGVRLYDSRVILEYLDHRAGGGRIIPKEPGARFSALTLQALCDGLMDASLLLVYEGRWRSPDRHEPKWVAHQADKVSRALATLEADPPALDGLPHVGQIALACALGYQDLRFDGRSTMGGTSLFAFPFRHFRRSRWARASSCRDLIRRLLSRSWAL
jgi:glutathione S-transferase